MEEKENKLALETMAQAYHMGLITIRRTNLYLFKYVNLPIVFHFIDLKHTIKWMKVHGRKKTDL